MVRTEDDDLRRFAEMTPEERLELFLELCDLTDSIVRHRPNVDELLAPIPRSPESEARVGSARSAEQ